MPDSITVKDGPVDYSEHLTDALNLGDLDDKNATPKDNLSNTKDGDNEDKNQDISNRETQN